MPAKRAPKQAASPMPTAAAPVAPPAQAAARVPAGFNVVVRAGAPYRTAAPHCQYWWANVQAALQAGGGTANLQALRQAGGTVPKATYQAAGTGAPGHFLGYCLRHGYLVPAA